MIPASELKVLVGVYGITEANKKLVKFDGDLKALASSDPTVTLRAEVDAGGFAEFEALKSTATDPATTTLRAEIDDLGFEEAGIKKAIFEDPATTRLRADVDDLGFEEGGLKKHIFEEEATTHLRAETSGFDTVIAQMDAIRTMAAAPIVQEVKLSIDKSSLAALATEDAAIGASTSTSGVGGIGEVVTQAAERSAEEAVVRNSSRGAGAGAADDAGLLAAILASAGGGGHGKGPLSTLAWGNHSPGSSGPWWMRAMMGGGKLAGAGSLGAFAGFGPEHFLFSGLGVLGSAGAGALGGGLMAGGALATQAVGGGSDMAVSKTTISDTTQLAEKYKALQQAVLLYGQDSKQAAKAAAELHLLEKQEGPAGKAELELAKSGTALGRFWNQQTQEARVNSTKVLEQVVTLGHDYVPLVAHAAEQNLSLVDKGLKPLFAWLEGPEGTGIFEHFEEEFAHNLPTAMSALDQGTQFVIKTLEVASEYTGGFIHSVDEFFIKWNNPQNFAIWEGHIEHLIGDFHLWETFIKALGGDIVDLFSQDAGSGEAIVVTITEMLTKLDEWETSTEGKEELHNLFVVHKEEIIALLQVIPPLISSLEPIYMTVAPPLVEAMTEILNVAADFLHLMDETGPVTRWALGLTLIGLKLGLLKGPLALLGKQLWSPFESLLAKDPLIGRFFEQQVTETDGLTTSTEGLTAAVGDLTTAYEAMGAAATTAGDEAAAAAAGTQMSLLGETTAAEGAAAGAGQMSFFPAGSGLAPAAEQGAGASAAEDVAGGGVLAGIGSKLSGFADDAAGSIFGKAGAVAAGYFAAEFGAKLIAPGALEGQNLEQALFHGFNTDEVAKTEAKALAGSFLREINHALADGGEPSGLQGASHNRARTTSKEQTDAMRAEAGVLGALKSGMVTQMADIEHLAEEGSTAAAAAFGEGSPQWRAASADNMEAAIQAIKAGEKAGLVTTEEGQHEIGHYLREYNLLTGDDPFHIASAFSHTWAEAGHVSSQGISKALGELRKMPAASQAVAEQTMLRQVKAFEHGGQLAKGTFSRLRSAIVTELQQTREHGGSQVEHFAEELEGSFGGLSLSVAGALENIGANVGGLLEQLGAHNPLQSFTIHYLRGQGVSKGAGSKYLGQVGSLERQEGGFTIPGTAEGDRHPMMLPYGSFIMNREATAAHGLQNGGHVPVLGESGERVFTPPEVAAIGARKLEWMNSSVPRFQEGGMLGAEPQLQGSQGALLSLGDAAIHMGYAAAQKYVDAHRPKTSPGGPISLSGGLVATPLQFAEYMIQAGFPKTVKVISEGLGTIMSESGFKVDNAQGPSGHIGPWAESPAFGSVKVREDPLGSTEAAYREWRTDGNSFWQAWGQWEAEQSGLSGGGAGSYGSQFRSTAEEALGQRGGRKAQRTGIPAANAHHHGLAEGGFVDVSALSAIAGHPGARLTPEQQKSHLAWKWGRRMAEGGLIAAEEERLGVPNSSGASAAKKAQSEAESKETPTEVVHWAMEHIGQKSPWDSESPGEWCGDFLADDMRVHGLPVPSGYALAENWGKASYGTALGRAHMQAGAVIDYGGQHVALAINSSEMVQGNDIHGVVGTSEIVGSVGGSPITAVRWPEYSKGHGPGAGSAPTEKVPGVFHGAHTKAVNPPSVPKTLHGIKIELHRWHGELTTYEQAAHLATGRPKLQHALQANVTRIQKYLRELERARTKLRKELAKKHYTHHLAKQLGKITGEEKNIEVAQRAYEVSSQYAEQVVGLEPTEPVLQQVPEGASEAQARQVEEANHAAEVAYSHQFEGFVEGRERPAYAKVLGDEAEWRNTILSAESKATGLEANWEEQLYSDDAIMARIPKGFQRMKERVDKWRAANPKAKSLPTILGREWQDAKYEMSLMPELRFQDKELRKSLGEARQVFYPGFPKALQPPAPPLPGSGEFEQELQEVQGIHWPGQHEHLAAAALAPPRQAGSFGGAIWDTQSAIEELGLKVEQAQGAIGAVGSGTTPISAAETERTQLLEELLRSANQEAIVRNIEVQTLGGLPYAGGYESGGMVAALVGEQGPEIIATRPGAYIRNANETSALLNPKVVINHYAAEERYEVEVNDRKVEAQIEQKQRRGARRAGRGFRPPGS